MFVHISPTFPLSIHLSYIKNSRHELSSGSVYCFMSMGHAAARLAGS
jgi:hypothetical protein